MSIWFLIQIIFNVIFIAFCFFLWVRSKKENVDDPRLSRGLQMVSSKIAILEDLSKQVDVQSQQISALLDQKAKQILQTIEKSDEQLNKIELAQHKSLQVAEIFQDRIPHEEIRQREHAKKYIEAARMAHEGRSGEEIQEALGLSMMEIEMISKVNAPNFDYSENLTVAQAPATPSRSEEDQLKALSEKFKKVPQMLEGSSKGSSSRSIDPKAKRIQPVQFPRIN